jgi:hypothetical protein
MKRQGHTRRDLAALHAERLSLSGKSDLVCFAEAQPRRRGLGNSTVKQSFTAGRAAEPQHPASSHNALKEVSARRLVPSRQQVNDLLRLLVSPHSH